MKKNKDNFLRKVEFNLSYSIFIINNFLPKDIKEELLFITRLFYETKIENHTMLIKNYDTNFKKWVNSKPNIKIPKPPKKNIAPNIKEYEEID